MSKVLFFSLPIMLSGILQLVFNAADTIVVGRFAGNEALAAVGSVGSLNNLLISLFIGLSVGVNVVVARYTGAHDYKRVSRAVHTAVLLSVISGIGLAVLGYVAAYPLLRLMGSPEDVIDLAALYVRILFMGMPVQLLYNFCAAVLRAIGDTKRPLYFLSFAGVINVVLNLIFVVGFHMSVAGVALATIISQAVSAILVVHCLMTMHGATHLNLRKLAIDKEIFIEIVRIGLPAGIQSSLFSISNVLIQSSVNSFGDILMSGNAAAQNIEGFLYVTMNSFHQTAVNFIGQNVGAKQYDRVKKIVWICLGCVLVTGLALGTAMCGFGEALLSIYITDSAEAISWGMVRLSIIAQFYFLCGLMDVSTGALRGLGASVSPMLISVLGICGVRILWIYTIFQAPQYHTPGCLFFSYPLSWVITLVAQMVLFTVIYRKRLEAYKE